MFTKAWFHDTAERTLATFLQGFLALVIAAGALDLSVLEAAATGGLMACLAVVKAAVATQVGDPGTASLDATLTTLHAEDFEVDQDDWQDES